MGYISQTYYKVNTYNRIYPHIKDGLVLCHKCLEYKPEELFYKSNKSEYRNKCTRNCKECVDKQDNKRKYANRGYRLGIDKLLNFRFLALKRRAKEHNFELDFGVEHLKELWIIQDGKCAISDIKMTYEQYVGRVSTNVSVDRINSLDGYKNGNVQLVCMAVNQMKNDLTQNELINFCKEIVKKWSH